MVISHKLRFYCICGIFMNPKHLSFVARHMGDINKVMCAYEDFCAYEGQRNANLNKAA